MKNKNNTYDILLEAYNIDVNDSFESCTALSAVTGKSNKTMSAWMKKEWIKQIT